MHILFRHNCMLTVNTNVISSVPVRPAYCILSSVATVLRVPLSLVLLVLPCIWLEFKILSDNVITVLLNQLRFQDTPPLVSLPTIPTNTGAGRWGLGWPDCYHSNSSLPLTPAHQLRLLRQRVWRGCTHLRAHAKAPGKMAEVAFFSECGKSHGRELMACSCEHVYSMWSWWWVVFVSVESSGSLWACTWACFLSAAVAE